MTVACHYAIVRFLPFVETGEFANVGVVVFSPASRYFGFRLTTARHARVTNFFDELDGKVFRTVMRQFREELERISLEFKPFGTDRRLRAFDRESAFRLWNELTKPLASVLRMSDPRVAMAADPQVKLKELFAYYVERNFVTKEYREDLLVRSVRGVLKELGVSDRYQHMRIGDDEYNAAFPLVATSSDDRPVQVIKPLNLAYDETTKILDHGAAWVHRVSTLKRRRLLPDDVLVVINGMADDSKQGAARQEVMSNFESLDVSVSQLSDASRVQSFALGLGKALPAFTAGRYTQLGIEDLLLGVPRRPAESQLLLSPPLKSKR